MASEFQNRQFEEAPAYDVAFDLSQAGIRHWQFCTIPLVLTLVGIVGLVLTRKKRIAQYRRWLLGVAILIGLALSTSCLVVSYSEYKQLVADYREGRTDFVEGEVVRFSPMPYEGHRNESFEINGQRFEYSDYSLSAGFNTTRSHRGPIREGIRVRIWHVGNTIVRLDVER
jgi:hypothetical protein